MIRLLTDSRMSLDPTRTHALPAVMVWTLYDALQLADHADYLNLPKEE